MTVTTSHRAQAQSSLPPAQARSQGIALRRGLTLLGMTLVVPGSAQLVGGNERLGRAALRVEADASDGVPAHLVTDMARCIGCGLCHAVCDAGALGPVQPPLGLAPDTTLAAPRLPLQRLRCNACGVAFYRPAGEAAVLPADRCRACERGRPLQHNRVVQTDAAS